jgi:hypothetical protein
MGSGLPAEPRDVDQALVDEIRKLNASEQDGLQLTLARQLDTQRARIEYAESRRGALVTVGGVVLAAGLAGLLTLAKTNDWNYFPAWLGLLCVTGSLVLTGVLVLAVYARQTNWNYPFKSASTTWKHFYRDAIAGADDPPAPWHGHQSSSFKTASALRFATIRTGYVARTLSLRDSALSLSQDIEQSYVLHWNEMYKNRFLTSLRKVLLRGVVLSVVVGAIGFVVGLVAAPDRYDAHEKQRAAATQTQQQLQPLSRGSG